MIQMLRSWNGLEFHAKYTLGGSEETRLVGLGLARYFAADIDGYSDNTFTPPESRELRELLDDGAGGVVMTISAPGGYDVGDVLTALPSTGWTVTGYQWTRNDVDIAGATSSTYTLTFADAATSIGCRAVGATYSASASIPGLPVPPGQFYLDGLTMYQNGSNLSLQ